LDTLDDLLWIHYGNEMVELLTQGTSMPGTGWPTRRRDQEQ